MNLDYVLAMGLLALAVGMAVVAVAALAKYQIIRVDLALRAMGLRFTIRLQKKKK